MRRCQVDGMVFCRPVLQPWQFRPREFPMHEKILRVIRHLSRKINRTGLIAVACSVGIISRGLLCRLCSSHQTRRRPGCRALSLRVVENDADRMTVSRPDAADAVPEIDPIRAASTVHRSIMNREHNTVTLAKRHNDRPRLQSRPLLRHHEFSTGKVFVGFGQ
jgi:hypothetical protein